LPPAASNCRADVDPQARDHRIANLQALRCENVSQLAIGIFDQRDERGAVRIIFQPLDGRRDVKLAALEIDDPVSLLMTAAAKPAGDAAMIIPAAGRMLALGQALDRLAFPQLRTVDQNRPAQARRNWVEML